MIYLSPQFLQYNTIN